MTSFQMNDAERKLACRFGGRMDTAACQQDSAAVETRVNEALQAGGGPLSVEFDLAGVAFVSSAFIRICLSTAKRIEKGRFSIVHTDASIKKTFKIAGLDLLLNVQ